MADALAARDRLLAAVEELRAASAVWAGVRNRYVWLGELTNRPSLGADVPSHPLGEVMSLLDRALAPLYSGELRDPRRLVPAPSDFLPDEREGETASERTIANG